jgi:hypothetical protein
VARPQTSLRVLSLQALCSPSFPSLRQRLRNANSRAKKRLNRTLLLIVVLFGFCVLHVW